MTGNTWQTAIDVFMAVVGFLIAGELLITGTLSAIGLVRLNRRLPRSHPLNRNLGLCNMVLGASLLIWGIVVWCVSWESLTTASLFTFASLLIAASLASLLLMGVFFWSTHKTRQEIIDWELGEYQG